MKAGVVAVTLSALAVSIAGYAITQTQVQRHRAPVRMRGLAELEEQIAELQREVAMLKRAQRVPARRTRDESTPDDTAGSTADAPTDAPAERDGALAAIVDDAVDRKTKQVMDELRIKANKKPDFKVFAKMLDLTVEQRAAAERVIIEGQRQTHELLNTPTDDGTNLMDQLVEIVARGIAEPGKDHGFGLWIGRIMSEKLPGTDITYATRIESVKKSMRTTFKRDWSEEQYREFTEWKVDPTEIENVPGSPNEALGKRIMDRVGTLGVDVPNDK